MSFSDCAYLFSFFIAFAFCMLFEYKMRKYLFDDLLEIIDLLKEIKTSHHTEV